MTSRRWWLWAEFLLLYFGLIAAYTLIDSPGSPIPPLLLLGGAAYFYLRRRPDFVRGRFHQPRPAGPHRVALGGGRRAFLMYRYAPIFGEGRGAAAASAAAFGFAHIIYGTLIAVALTVVAGWILTRTYQRTGSLLATAIEHSLYGVLAFTIGMGDIFYHGALGR